MRYHVDDERPERWEQLSCSVFIDCVGSRISVRWRLQVGIRTRVSTRQSLPAYDKSLDIRIPACGPIYVVYGDDVIKQARFEELQKGMDALRTNRQVLKDLFIRLLCEQGIV